MSEEKQNVPPIDLYEFLSKLNIVHTTLTNNHDTLMYLVENENKKIDCTTYKHVDNFLLFNVDVMKINSEGKYYYECPLHKDADMVGDFKLETQLKMNANILVNNDSYTFEEMDKLIHLTSQYSDTRIQFTFLEKPNIDDKFTLYHTKYYLNSDLRRKLAHSESGIITKHSTYKNGFCKKIYQ